MASIKKSNFDREVAKVQVKVILLRDIDFSNAVQVTYVLPER